MAPSIFAKKIINMMQEVKDRRKKVKRKNKVSLSFILFVLGIFMSFKTTLKIHKQLNKKHARLLLEVMNLLKFKCKKLFYSDLLKSYCCSSRFLSKRIFSVQIAFTIFVFGLSKSLFAVHSCKITILRRPTV